MSVVTMSSYSKHSVPNLDCFSAPFVFFSIAKCGELTYFSPSAQEVLGLRPDEEIGKKYTDFLDLKNPINVEFQRRTDERFASGVTSSSTMHAVFDTNKGKRILRIQTYGEADASGEVILNHAIAQDITDSLVLGSDLHRRWHVLQSVRNELSKREKQVLERVMNGRLNKSIARELDVTQRTVESARSRLIKKFGAKTTAELVRLATELTMLTNIIESLDEEVLPQATDLNGFLS